jgi:hypothetical protein
MRPAQLAPMMIALLLGTLVAGAAPRRSSILTDELTAQLWIDPVDLEKRDLFRGPVGGPAPPDPNQPLRFIKRDTSGRSPGYTARDTSGVVWSVKLGPEAQAEVVTSRLLWAIGFHQLPNHYSSKWTVAGVAGDERDFDQSEGGRFRPELPGYTVISDWRWDHSPVSSSYAMGGLVVAMMMINNWDLKTSNNKLYEVTGSPPRRLYVVRDLGASLGSNKQPQWLRWSSLRAAQGSKNDLEDFEAATFIDGVDNGYVTFAYRGPNDWIGKRITPSHVRWTAQLMSRLSDQQWRDAFRAGGYTPEESERFIRKFKEKIALGLTLQ